MNAVVQVYKNKELVEKHPLLLGKFVIGRSSKCDLSIKEDLVSKQHAVILREAGAFWIEDCHSRNGTMVNKEKVSGRRRLKSGDRIFVGSAELVLNLSENAADDEGETRPGAEPDKELRPGQRIKKKKETGRWQVKLKVLEGYLKGEVFENWEGGLKIGKRPENDVPMLSDDYVSKDHAEIVGEADRYFIVDLDSDNGTFLNKRKIQPQRREPLSNGDKIRVGRNGLLVFELVDLERDRERRKKLLVALLFAMVAGLLIWSRIPPNVAGQRIEAAQKNFEIGKFQEASNECAEAIHIAPTRKEARVLMNTVTTYWQARDHLREAYTLAKEGKLDEARTSVSEALRLVPGQKAGKDLMGLLDDIQNADSAMKFNQWDQAIKILTPMLVKSSGTAVVSNMLARARSEKNFMAAIQSAQILLTNHSPEQAEASLKVITANSSYHTRARGLLKRIADDRNKNGAFQAARAAYDDGNIEQALTKINETLVSAPKDADLLGLQTKVIAMRALTGGLVKAEAMQQSNSLDELLAGMTNCGAVLELESNPRNDFSKRAEKTQNRIRSWLISLSQNYVARAQDKALNIQRNPSDLKEACRLFLLALKADGSNEIAKTEAERLRQEIQFACQKLFFDGYRLTVGEKTQALAKFNEVTTIGLPDLFTDRKPKDPGDLPADDWYGKAQKWINDLSK